MYVGKKSGGGAEEFYENTFPATCFIIDMMVKADRRAEFIETTMQLVAQNGLGGFAIKQVTDEQRELSKGIEEKAD